ncbi:thiosulfate ABC transporter substrate-binding protein CysP [Pantoea sp. Mhis]|uniref:thiosulfate ABC transporter substrate-binding protein CysP n=1 Tax=Pantoea sp. Mhis TaxID=2576759 RepID=UPI00135AA39A|nr:thiosulfate ABC transporter substrate-binding protein CysP [Pantoea sp. Mhis]MXP56068.1 sulfate ABC transporter substrate-binding protein [Pantoea sp. Mhis]
MKFSFSNKCLKLLSNNIKILLVMTIYSLQATELLNSSYDISRELFISLNSPFQQQWNISHPNDKLIIKQSHAGSSKQALALLQGLRADVVTYNQFSDVQILHDKGNLIPNYWQTRLPNNSSPFYSTMAFLVRKGNPKKIYDWSDLVNNNIKIILSNPKTSGNGRYAYLAAWGATDMLNANNKIKTKTFMTKLLKNIEVFDTGGRGATTTFIERGLGDVLISFESEVNNIYNQYDKEKYEIIVPKTNIKAEFPVAWIDKNIKHNGTSKVAKAYLNYLYTPEAQKIMIHFHYRVNNSYLMSIKKAYFPQIILFNINDTFGSWNNVMKTHFSVGGELETLLAKGRN